MMKKYAVIEKRVGETPLMAIEAFRRSDPSLSHLPLSYAGRLDPMASGQLVVLIGDECKKRGVYDGLDKTYVFEVLLGFSSDTGDILGLPKSGLLANPDDASVAQAAASLVGSHTFEYPAFSSKTVNGKPLFTYALSGGLEGIEIPTIDVRIYSLRYRDRIIMSKDDLLERILSRIELLKVRSDPDEPGSDFRKEQIMRQWWDFADRRKTPCCILRFEATVSPGTYIRTIAPLIAERLGTVGLAYSIRRTRIGTFVPIFRSRGVWTRTL